MANKALESTVLSIEVQSAIDKDGNPTSDLNKVQVVASLITDLLGENTRNFYVTELSQIQE